MGLLMIGERTDGLLRLVERLVYLEREARLGGVYSRLAVVRVQIQELITWGGGMDGGAES